MNTTSVYVIICLDEEDTTRNVNVSTVVNGVYSTKEKARQKLQQVIKEFMVEYERDVLYYGEPENDDEDEEEDYREEVTQLSDDAFSVYGRIWNIVETVFE